MPIIYDQPRQVVPRWRPFGETLIHGELTFLLKSSPFEFDENRLSELLLDWKENPTLSFASDLLSIAFAFDKSGIAEDAASFVVEHPNSPQAARDIAEIYLGKFNNPNPEPLNAPPDANADHITPNTKYISPFDRIQIVQIQKIKESLRVYPRNPIQWCNLSLRYTSMGELTKAEKAMKIALTLAPDNRFVLRSASRFFLHLGEREFARNILTRSSLIDKDPWVMSAEIAISDASKRTSRCMRRAKKVLESKPFSPKNLSELASAVGTIEVKSGKNKAGRKIIEQSLQDPSENSIAQAAWVARNFVHTLEVPFMQRSSEALTWNAWKTKKWESSLTEALNWQQDQMFSSRPAIYASYVNASVFENYKDAISFAEFGLRSNPNDKHLLNNLAFAAAKSGDILLAQDTLRQIHSQTLTGEEKVVFLATTGLVAYRSGLTDIGRNCYNQAIKHAKIIQDDEREIQAQVYLALEESRIQSNDAKSMCLEAVAKLKDFDFPLRDVLQKKVEAQLKTFNS